MARLDEAELLSRAGGLLPDDVLRGLVRTPFDADRLLQVAAERTFSNPHALAEALLSSAQLRDVLIDLKMDVEEWLGGIAAERDPGQLGAKQTALAMALDERQAMIKALAGSVEPLEARRELEGGISDLMRIIRAVSRAFKA